MKKLSSDYIFDFISFVDEAQKHYKFCFDEVNNQDKLTQDYLHSLELGDLSYGERSKVATQLVKNRKDRRYYKDEVEEYEPIVKFFEDPNNKRVLDKLKEVLGQTRKAESYHKDRAYKPKVKKDELSKE